MHGVTNVRLVVHNQQAVPGRWHNVHSLPGFQIQARDREYGDALTVKYTPRTIPIRRRSFLGVATLQKKPQDDTVRGLSLTVCR